MGWIMTMFDLPVMTAEERKAATSFRKHLLEDGYSMINFSVYVRPCVDWQRMRKHAERLQTFVPEGGNVRSFFITDRQWQDAILVIGEDYSSRRKVKSPKMPEQLEFW